MISATPYFKRALLGLIPVETLNEMEISQVKFVKAEALPLDSALTHVWWDEDSSKNFRAAYWREVDNGNIAANNPHARETGNFMRAWLQDLSAYWITLGELHPIESGGKQLVRRAEFKAVLKKWGIPRPLTWR